jgi:hypothetical protein
MLTLEGGAKAVAFGRRMVRVSSPQNCRYARANASRAHIPPRAATSETAADGGDNGIARIICQLPFHRASPPHALAIFDREDASENYEDQNTVLREHKK